jgi:hypothetical protein
MGAETTYRCDGPECGVIKEKYEDLHGWIQVATLVDPYEKEPRKYHGAFHDVSCLVEWAMVEEDRADLDEVGPRRAPAELPGGQYL